MRMKIYTTVVSWQQGRALLQTESSTCGTCNKHTPCSLKQADEQQLHEIFIEQPLIPGQQICLNITAGNLLYAGFIVYLIPLSGLLLGAAGFHWLFFNDYLTAAGAFTGGSGGFLMARFFSTKYEKQIHYQVKILQTTLTIQDEVANIINTKANWLSNRDGNPS